MVLRDITSFTSYIYPSENANVWPVVIVQQSLNSEILKNLSRLAIRHKICNIVIILLVNERKPLAFEL